MRFFRTEPQEPPAAPETPPPPPVLKLPAVDGWSADDLRLVYNAAFPRSLKAHEPVFGETAKTESFFILLDGAIQVTFQSNGQPGCPAVFGKGDCVAPLLPTPGLSYRAEATVD